MLKNKTISILTTVYILLFSVIDPLTGTGQETKMDKAITLYENGSYSEAALLFRELINSQPENPMLNYYYGSSQTEMGIYATPVLNLLITANQEKEKVPEKIDYYLGAQYQAQEQWEQALRHYNRFKINTPEATLDELNLAEKIQQCYNHENPFSISSENSDILRAETEVQTNNTFVNTTTDSLQTTDTLQIVPTITDSIEGIENTVSGIPIKFIINSEITYRNTDNFQTEDGKNMFTEASAKQMELDNILQNADELRENYKQAKLESEKQTIGQKILSLENESYKLKDEINQLLKRSRNSEIKYWQNTSEQERIDFIDKLSKLEEKNIEQPAPETNTTETPPDTSIVINPNIILDKMDIETPAGNQPEMDELVYKIQIGAYSKKLPSYIDQQFKKLALLRKIDHYTDENGVTVYTTGNLTNLEDAVKMQNQVRQEGIRDAFVVPYFNEKRITLKQAKEISKEQ